jgi:fumarylacetoacetase
VTALAYGVLRRAGEPGRVVVRRQQDGADDVVDLAALADAGRLGRGDWWRAGTLQPLLAAGRDVWREVHEEVAAAAADAPAADLTGARLVLPWQLGDYVDFYSSLHHAENVGRMFRPDGDPLLPNWKHLPVGYHGRAGTVVVGDTPVVRPRGQRPGEGGPTFGPSQRLDVEVEVGFVVGVPSALGEPVPVSAYRDHVFGLVLVNDWSARDVQAWEYQPLGPFLGKSFATSVSPWVVPLDALDGALVDAPAQDPPVLDYLRTEGPQALDLALELRVNGTVVSRPPFASMYWTPPQQLAHLTVNGASLRTGDLFASGTVSGPEREQRGSLLELSWGGKEPLTLDDGSTRAFLEDGDVVEITGTAPAVAGGRLDLGTVRGRIEPAR